MTIKTALAQGIKLLDEAGVVVPKLTAEVLLAAALKKDRAWLTGHGTDELPEVGWIHFGRYLHERLRGKPTQYITRVQEFYGRDFRVEPGVLIPRPETEHLIEQAIRIRPDRIVDIGTGSGAIAVTLALELSRRIFATDLSGEALRIAARNSSRHVAPVCFAECDLASCFAASSFDCVISNPPYVPLNAVLAREVRDWEPALALYAGADGTSLYERLIPEARRVLGPGGWLLMEIGAGQQAAVASLLRPSFDTIDFIPDLAGIPRVAKARSKP